MRYRIRAGCLILVLFAGTAAVRGNPLPNSGSPPDPDAEFLQEVGIGSGDAQLLECLHNRAVGQVDPARVERLVRALGSDDFRERDRATSELIRLGFAARERLRQAAADKDAEIATRAQACLKRLEQDIDLDVPRAAVRLLVRRRADGAEEALLRYLPSARDEGEEEEIVYGLDALAVARGRLVPSVRAALRAKSAACRAAAACIVGRRGSAEDRAAVRRLLADPSPLVRLRAAQGLLAAGDKAGLPALIALLDEPSVTISWQAEELLHWAGWGSAPAEVVGAATPEERQRCRAAWEAWYRQHGTGLDLTKPAAQRRPGLLLACTHDGRPGHAKSGKVFLYGCDGKPRWQLEGPLFCDVQLLPGDRVLLGAEDHITERDLHGKVLWQEQPGRFRNILNGVCRRLRDGNTFVGNIRDMAWELDAKGNEVVAYYRLLDDNGCFPSQSSEPYPLGNGGLAYLDIKGNVVEADRVTGRVRKQFPPVNGLGAAAAVLDVLSDGHRLLAAWLNLVEIDGAGKVVWRCQAPPGVSAARLRNGNVVVCAKTCTHSLLTPALLEFDPAGRKVWEDLDLGYVRRVRVCLPLVGLGFDRPPIPAMDWDSAERRARGLKDPDPEKRQRALQFLEDLGPKAAPAIPALIDALNDPDPWTRRHAEEFLWQLGEASLRPSLEAQKDRRPNVRAGAVMVVGVLRYRGQIHRDVKPIVQSVLAALHDESAIVRRKAALAAGYFAADSKEVVPALIQALKDPDRRASPSESSVAENAADRIGLLGAKARAAVPALLEAMASKDDALSGSAMDALGRIAAKDKSVASITVPKLIAIFKDEEQEFVWRERVAATLGQIGPEAHAAVPALREALAAKDVKDPRKAAQFRDVALIALGGIGPGAKDAVPDLIAILEDQNRDPGERRFAAYALGGIGPAAKSAVPALTKIMQDRNMDTPFAQVAGQALRKIQR